jgi:hypothetical protein
MPTRLDRIYGVVRRCLRHPAADNCQASQPNCLVELVAWDPVECSFFNWASVPPELSDPESTVAVCLK